MMRMIGYAPAVREALSLQKGHILVGYSLSELIQEPGFAYPGLGHDGKGLPSACLGPFKTIKQKLKLPLPSHKRSQTPLGTDVKSCPSGTGGDHPVDIDRLFLTLDFPLPQSLKPKESLGELECILCHIGRSWLCQPFHPGGQIHRVTNCLELYSQIITQGTHNHRTGVNADSHFKRREHLFFLVSIGH